MKKFPVLLYCVVSAVAVSVVPTACDLFTAGLGGKVDMDPPALQFSAPSADYIRSVTTGGVAGITFSGTVTDDIGVAGVVLSWTDQGTSGLTGSLPATVSQGAWSVTVPEATFTQGTAVVNSCFKFMATATDTSGRATSVPKTYTLDTNLPFGAVSTFTDSSTAHGTEGYPFNGTETIAGSAKDPGGEVSTLVVKIAGVQVLPATGQTLTGAQMKSWSASVGFDGFLTAGDATWGAKDAAKFTLDKDGDGADDADGICKALVELYITDVAGNESIQATAATEAAGTAERIWCYINPAADKPQLNADYSNLGVTSYAKGDEIIIYVTDDDGLNTASLDFEVYAAGDVSETDIGGKVNVTSTAAQKDSSGNVLGLRCVYPLPTSVVQGDYYINFSISDDSGVKNGSAAATYTIDDRAIKLNYGTKPDINIGSLLSVYPSTSVTVTGNASANASTISAVELSVDDANFTSPLTASQVSGDADTWVWSYPLTGLSQGSRTIYARVTDAAASSTTATATIIVDTVAPTILVTPPTSAWTNSLYLAVSGTASDGVAGSGISAVEYSLTGGAPWTTLRGTETWADTITLAVGANTLSFRSADNATHYSAVATESVSVDLSNPILTVTSPSASRRVNGLADLPVVYTATDLGGSGLLSVQITKIGSTTLVTPISAALASGSEFNGTWTATIPKETIAALTDGSTYEVTATATDVSTRASTASFNLLIDTAPPSVAISAPDSGTPKVNKTIAVSGTGGDAQALSSVVITLVNSSSAVVATPATFSDASAYNWSTTLDTTTLDDDATYDSDLVTPGVQLRLVATATDEAGNTATTFWTGTIDQDADRPLIKMTQLTTLGDTNGDGTEETASSYIKGSRTVTGTVSDDDGTITALYISTDGTFDTELTKPSVPVDTGSWSLDLASDGLSTLYFMVIDAKGATFTSGASSLSSPYIYNKASTAYSENAVSLRVDTTDPIISTDLLVQKADLSTVSFDNNIALGGANQTFSVIVPASDANGIASVAVTLALATPVTQTTSTATGTSGSYTTYTAGPFDVSSVTVNKIYTVSIKVTDSAGLSVTTTRSVLIDNNAPTVSVTNPRAKKDTVNGDITVSGTCSDTTSGNSVSSGIVSFAWQVGLLSNLDPAAAGWTALSGTTFYSWEFNLSSIETYATMAGNATLNGDGLYELPIYFRIKDGSGNVRITAASDYILWVDPDKDKPTVTTVYPDPEESNRKLGGTVRISGIAKDDDAVQEVYVQLANDSAFSDPINGSSGALATGTTSWSYKVNTGSYTDGKVIYFRSRARDIYGTYGPWTNDTYNTIAVDRNVPSFGAISLTNSSTGAVRTYSTSNTYLSGTWVLSGTVTDTSAVSAISLSDFSSTGGTCTHADSFSTGSGTATFSITLATSGTGSVSFTLTAVDNSSPPNETPQEITLYYDNTAPVLATGYTIDKIVQSNNVFDMGSTITEEGSGIERVAFFFVRRSASSSTLDRVYNPIASDGGSQDFTYLNALTFTEGDLPYKALSGVSLDGSGLSLTSADLAGNVNAKVGALIRINGIDHKISAVNTGSGTVTWNDGEVTAVTSAALVYASVVDHSVTETPNWSSGNLTSITSDDGDFLIESLSNTGSAYTWEAWIDSLEIPDGPITLYYVAYDKAGNASWKSISTTVRNNPPLLAAVVLGTDLNGDSTVDMTTSGSDEHVTYPLLDGSGNEQASASALSSAFTAKDKSKIAVDIVGGNGNLYYTLVVNGTTWRTLQSFTDAGDIDLSKAELGAAPFVEDAANTLGFTILDSTEELSYTAGTSQKAVLTVPMKVNVADGLSPMAVIDRFFWTSEASNSLYGNSRANGHIEKNGVVGDTADPKVSGTLTLTGSAYDETRLGALYLRIENAAGTILYPTATYTTGTYYSEVYFKVATYTSGSGWSPETLPAGMSFSIVTNELSQAGHKVTWKLDWNTATIFGVVGNNTNIQAVSVDTSANTSAAASSGSSADVTSYNLPSYQVDVVPYIRTISRASNTHRSSQGNYPMRMGETGVTLTGFNLRYLNGNDSLRVVTAETGTMTGPTTDYDELTVDSGSWSADANTELTSLTFTMNATHSGWLRLISNSVEAVNGANTDTDAWNLEDESSGTASGSYTDDRYISLWETGSHFLEQEGGTAYSTNISAPSMTMDRAGTLYATWPERSKNRLVLANTTGNVSVLYSAFDEPQYSNIEIDPVKGRTSIAYLTDFYSGGAWGSIAVATANAPSSSGAQTMGYYGVEWEGSDGKLLQFQNPKVVRYATSGSTAATEILNVCYYDMDTGSVKFSGFLDNNTGAIDYGSGNHKGSVVIDGGYDSEAASIRVSAGTTTSSAAGEFHAIDIDENGYPVIMYYDNAGDCLKLAYATSSAVATTMLASGWGRQAVVSSGNYASGFGRQVAMKINRTTGVLHAVAYSDRGELVYLKATDADGSAYTFSAPVVLDTGVSSEGIDIVLDASGNPFISYRDANKGSSLNGLKYASYNGTSWDVSTVPVATTVEDSDTSIEVYRTTSGVTWTATWGKTAIAYLSTTYDLVYLKDEE